MQMQRIRSLGSYSPANVCTSRLAAWMAIPLLFCGSSGSFAQSGDADQHTALEEVVVTTSRREESLQRG